SASASLLANAGSVPHCGQRGAVWGEQVFVSGWRPSCFYFLLRSTKKKGRAFRPAPLSLAARPRRFPITFGDRRALVRLRITLRNEAPGDSTAVLCDFLGHGRLLSSWVV